MKRKIIHDISASSIQVIINQIAGVVVFYTLSKFLPKSIFGEISWCLAVLMLSFAILGFGIDQVVVKKTASGLEPAGLGRLYFFHVLLAGISFLILTGLIILFTGTASSRLHTLLLLAGGQFLIFLTVPFKQIANGREAFKSLLLMSVGANMVKVAGLILLAVPGRLTLHSFIVVYTIASAAELFICLIVSRRFLKLRARPFVNLTRYTALVRESLPQLGVIICNAGIARFDWILLGIISTTSILAEYSFAYKVFEMSTLPLLIIAPLLLPRITKWFKPGASENLSGRYRQLLLLAKYEIILACFGSLLLNIIWTPLVDGLTNNKYGRVNQWTILILSACVPLLYINNILWSVNFSCNKMKLILSVFVTTCGITCFGDLLLIPLFHAEGAALAFFIAMTAQTIYFLQKTPLENGHKIRYYLLSGMGSGLIGGLLAKYSGGAVGTQIVAAVCVYLVLIVFTRLLRFSDFLGVKKELWAHPVYSGEN